jgi:hypothetical protein
MGGFDILIENPQTRERRGDSMGAGSPNSPPETIATQGGPIQCLTNPSIFNISV